MTLSLFLYMTGVIALGYLLEEHTRWAAHISGVLLLIIIASFLGNIGIVPSGESSYTWFFQWAVLTGIILMLLAFNPRDILHVKKDFLICFFIGALGTTLGGLITGLLLKQFLPDDYWRISAQLTASYIGGYENAVAVGQALHTPNTIFLKIFAGDSVLTTLWIAVNIFQGRKIKIDQNNSSENKVNHGYFTPRLDLTSLAITITATLAVIATSLYLHSLFPGVHKILWASVLATSLTFTPLRYRFSSSYIVGSFILSYFFFACGAISDVVTLFNDGTFLIIAPTLIISIHAIILFGVAKLLKIKKEIVITVSQCLIGGPATALAVVSARKWNFQFEAVILGLLGYAIANYIGLSMAWILR